jgi:hypothetical protein
VPKRVEEIPDRGDRKYAWDLYMDGRTWKFSKGEDFETEPNIFANACRMAAKRRAATIDTAEINIRGDDVYVRFVSRSTPLVEER